MAYCRHCGKYVKDGTEICPECGCLANGGVGTKIVNKPQTSTNRTSTYSLSDDSDNKLKTVLIIKIILCTIGIIFGVGFLAWYYQATYEWRHLEFGGDFYTEIYDVTQRAANNIVEVNHNIGLWGGWFFIFSSAFCLVCSIGSYYKGLALNKINRTLTEIKNINKK